MMRSRLVIPILATLTLSGCGIGSLNPVFPDSARRFDGRLLGTWTSKNNESVVVTSNNSRSYTIVFKNAKGVSARFVGRLGQIGTHSVLDIVPDKSLLQTTDEYKDLLLPVHTALFLDSIGAEVRFRTIRPDSLQAVLGRDPTAIAHVDARDMTLLTATSSELQSFLERLVDQPGVLGDATVFVSTAVAPSQQDPH